jgi:small subunit ribosomal protein S16
MAVRIRLRRTGKRNAPVHRIVVADGRSPRDGRFIEILGYYDPRNKDEKIDLERADYWISQGAQPSETVEHIIERAKSGREKEKKAPPPTQAKSPKTPKADEEAEEAAPTAEAGQEDAEATEATTE